ncbi:Cell morphogenesis protein PAG1 [Coemansia sp. RSA 720]|nr:Cell morphogenesis protein PAG1 [Coemansia sp. RSA 720]
MAAPLHGTSEGPSEPRPNPFGNYSLLEAQQPARAVGSSAFASARDSPFANYSFKEAQQNDACPSSPTSTHGVAYESVPDAHVDADTHTVFVQAADSVSGDGSIHSRLESDTHQHYAGMGAEMGSSYSQSGVAMSIEQYAIRTLYEEFRDRAAAKIETIVELRLDREPNLAKHLGYGADPTFDRTLEKLGMLARRRPRVIIELLLVWRKTTIDAADEDPLESIVGGGAHDPARQYQHPQQQHQAAALSRAHYIVRERKSLVSVYILCRALDAVVAQLDASHLEGDLGDRLEELVFGQVKQVNPANLRRSQNRREIQDLYARMIGRISGIRFSSMSDRFIAELERIPMVSSSSDERIVELLHNMRFIRLRVYPIDALEESSAFLLSCAKFYSRTSGSLRLKHAWASLLTELLMPMAAVVDAEVNLPELVQAIDIIYAKAMKMAAKVRHVTVAFPLAAATLCVSRRDIFHQRWLSLLEYCIQRLKDKQFRRVSMDAILRMLWVYLFRYPESTAVVLRRIDSLSRIFFPATKLHAWPKTVPPAAFVYFLVCAACYSFDFASRQLLQNMLQVDSGWPGTSRDIGDAGPILDTLNPARVALAFQALVSVAAIASNNASAANATTAPVDASDGIDRGSAVAAAAAAAADSAGQAATLFRPPFPGVAQLSGLDIFASDLQSESEPYKSVLDGSSSSAKSGHPGDRVRGGELAVINPDVLPENISNALTTAISVVSRYCSVLTPVFGNYILADERLWRQSCAMPLFSSNVLTGLAFSQENTALLVHGPGQQKALHGSQVAATAASSSLGGNAVGSGGAVGSSTLAGPVMAKSASDEASDRHYMDEASGSASGAGDAVLSPANGSGGVYGAAETARHVAARYPAERQAYVDLMTAYMRNMPRAQLFWEQIESQKLIETLVHSVLHVDQPLAAESRACLLDLLCPPSMMLAESNGNIGKPSMFVTKAERLTGVTQAVVRATQLLRAVDERFSAVLVAGIFACDARSNVSLAQPGDPLVDTPGVWPYCVPQGVNGSGQRFVHTANLSTASAASNGMVLPPLLSELAGRNYADGASELDPRDEGLTRHGYSSSGQLGDTGDSDIDAGRSSTASAAAAAAAIAAALDAKARFDKSPASEPVGHELNGGFLHVYLDLIHYLEISLHEYLSDGGAAGLAASQADSSQDRPLGDRATNAGADTGGSGAATIGDRSLIEWAKLICAIEANAVAVLCSSNFRVRRLAVDVLYQAGVLRRILAAYEPVPQLGHSWLFRNTDSAYEVLNVVVPPKQPDALHEPLPSELWNVPFRSDSDATNPTRPQPSVPLARAAASAHDADMALWETFFPAFIRRASVQIPDVMLVARTLVCQRLYQMQPLMTQYSEVSVRANEARLTAVRVDLVGAFGSLFLFAIVSLPSSGDSLSLVSNRLGDSLAMVSNRLGESASGMRSPKGNVSGTSLNSSGINGANVGLSGSTTASNSAAGGSSRSRLAKSIARKLAPLKSTSRGSKQEQGAGLASISQLVRMASVILRSDNAPLRQHIAFALSSTPAVYLHELMQELRPLADTLLDDGSAQTSHRNYLHVSNNAAASSSTGLLISSLSHHYHGLTSSPNVSSVGSTNNSPKVSAQVTPHASKRRMAKAGSGSRVRDGGLGSDTEASGDSVTAAQSRPGRRANSFDAAAVGSALSAKKPSHSHNDGSNVDPGASASVAAVNAGAGGVGSTSTTAVQVQRRRRRLLRLSLAQIYKQVSRQLDASDHNGRVLWQDEQLMAQLVAYVRETKTFLSESSVQWEWEHQPLRAHFCGLVEGLYYFISSDACAEPVGADSSALKSTAGRRPHTATSMFTPETRNGLYQLFGRWCSLGRHAEAGREAQLRMIGTAVDQIKDSGEREAMTSVLEGERRLLERAALRAMAVLCRSCGQAAASVDAEKGAMGAAELGGEPGGPREKAMLFAWVSDALSSSDPHVQRVGQHAVMWTIMADVKDAAMMRVVIQLAYGITVAGSINNGFALAESKMGSANTSGLGLVFGGSNDGKRALSDATALALSSDRVMLGYLHALTSVLSPAPLTAKTSAASRSLSLTYVDLVLPLVLFHLHSERRRVRRQALVLLRGLCMHAAADVCRARVDELGPSIVSDIPAIALGAVERLGVAVARALAMHTGAVIEEAVRQVHVQGVLDARRGGVLRRLVRPWLANVELESARFTSDDEAMWGLEPVGLSRDSVRVLRCMLFLTVRTGQEGLVSMQGLWLALVERSAGRTANLWLIVRHLTGLLAGAWSTALLGFARRICVFLSRSSQGAQLVRLLIDEATRPGATMPLDARLVDADASDVLAGEAWAGEIAHLVDGDRTGRPLVSTGALAAFYLSAISYEQPMQLAEYQQLAILPPVVFMLAHPERWVRDAARTVLVNLVAAERIACTGNGMVGMSQVANEAAHYALTVLRGDECLSGFGNVDVSRPHKSPPELDALNDSDEHLPSAWTVVAAVPDAGSLHTRSPSARDASLLDLDRDDTDNSVAADGPKDTELNVEASDPSLVADVADIPAAMSQANSPGDASDSHRSELYESGSAEPMRSVDVERRRSSLSTMSRRSPSAEGAMGDGATGMQLHRFMVHLSRLFGGRFSGCAQTWAGVAVQWAMSCPVRPLASLALQAFSALIAEARFGGSIVITPTRTMVLRLIDRLSNIVGDSSPDVLVFAETVIAALRQLSALVARMCADDELVVGDLLATSLVLMRTAQTSSVYAMALSVFERVFRAAQLDEKFQELIAQRVGEMQEFQPALLRGLEFAVCRERCLALLRETLQCEKAQRDCAMLALAAHMPVLLDGASSDAEHVQAVAGHGVHRHNYKRAQMAGLGSSLGLTFDGPHDSARVPDIEPLSQRQLRRRGAPQNTEHADSSDTASVQQDQSRVPDKYTAFIDECSHVLDGAGRDTSQLLHVLSTSSMHDIVRQFGYAAVSCGPSVCSQIVSILLRYLHPSEHTRIALRYMRDHVWTTERELRRMDVCLQLLHSVLGDSTCFVDSAMAPSLRHLFDLLVVARPISDLASRVLHVLLRFDEIQVGPSSMWYEEDAGVLQSVARDALARIVRVGFDQSDAGTVSRSVSPEMPVLVIPHADVEHETQKSDTSDLLAELDEFDRELDAALGHT